MKGEGGVRAGRGVLVVRAFFCLFLLGFLFGCGDQDASKGKRANRPPGVKQVKINPEVPLQGQDLQAVVHGADLDGDPVVYSFRWEINGQVVPGEDQPVLPSSYARPGDKVVVWAIPSDGKVLGREVSSSVVDIRAPERPLSGIEVGVSPQPAFPGDLLEARVTGEGMDDAGAALRYTWTVNGRDVEGVASNRFSTEGLRRGDRIQVRAVLETMDTRDREASQELVLKNRPPKILSEPPETLIAEGHYRYEVKAEDPDRDPLTFRLEGKVPEGMKIDRVSGVLDWQFSAPPEGPIFVDIRVRDGLGGEAQQSFDFTISQAGSS